MRLPMLVVCGLTLVVGFSRDGTRTADPHNVILFVPDGLRALKVDASIAPVMASIRDRGVSFTNPHALFPTFTMPNASALATGHAFGDTGTFSNTIFSGFAATTASGSVTPFIENDAVLGEVDAHFAGDYVNETTVARAARDAGFSTALVGKLGPALLFDHTDRSGTPTIVVDDSTGAATGIPLTADMKAALAAAGLPLQTPGRGENGQAGTATVAGTKVANVGQQQYFVDVTTKVLLPLFKARGRPFLLVYWSRDPDGTQHYQGDSLNQLTPGINGPTSDAAVRNADSNLGQIQAALAALGLADATNVIVSADHGFSSVSKQSQTSAAARRQFTDVPRAFLPPGFLALDIAAALQLPVFDPDANYATIEPNAHPRRGNGVIGADARNPDVIVASNGGSDLIYLSKPNRTLAGRVIRVLLAQDYVSGIFVDSALGSFAGTLPLKAVHLEGTARTPRPAIVVSFRSESTGCAQPVLCAVTVADSTLQQGQGMHGSFSRADTMNFMAAMGPDFRQGFSSVAPASNADVGRTLVHLLGLSIKSHGSLVGRVLTEALRDGKPVSATSGLVRSEVAPGGLQTILRYQQVGQRRYFDAAGFRGRTVGLER